MKKVLIIALLIFLLFAPKLYEEKKESDNLKQKIGQMLILGFRGTEVDENSGIVKEINKYNLGGVILFDWDVPSKQFPRNIIDPEQTKKLIAGLKDLTSPSLFVAVDAEGGLINRLKEKYGFVNIPSAQEMGKEDLEKTKENSLVIAKELSDLGINVDFAPVVDVNVNPDNPVIGGLERSFSQDPEKVALYASKFIEGLHEKNIIPAIKHFPGHGSSTEDSHLGMVDVTDTYEKEEIIPYQKLTEQGYSDMVMTAHIVNRNIDPDFPATLSPLFIEKILREDLGFKGVVVSDDMNMGAIVEHYGFDEALIKAIQAGCDLLIISNNGSEYNEKAAEEAVEAIFQAIKKGELSEERINESFNRIQELKEKYGIK
ncbi:MAG: beta-N-acetylhexosaminidase [Candidatus Pacebacteria bacterium]|nr:beta-N-acetylhexosaminidase [Candidatus Paceibacterota bacterium]